MSGLVVNDIHSRLNPTDVRRIERPASIDAVQRTIRTARVEGLGVSVSGGRHAMGGQQFGEDTILLDMRGMDRVLAFDPEAGEIEVEAGIQWPGLVTWLIDTQAGREDQWGIIQKQTGADRLTIGGALAANIHGRGLTLPPVIADVVSFRLVTANGEVVTCSRDENRELFSLAIGGYGLFGVIVSVRLRLARRRKMQRIVEIADVDGLADAFAARIAAGFEFGDFQFAIDPASDDFIREGVFACYRPVSLETEIPGDRRMLSREDWQTLLLLAHTDKRLAVDIYKTHYLATSGQVYWSDLHQLADYFDGYHEALDTMLETAHPASEMITELYVPRASLAPFLTDIREDFRANDVDLIYGTIRLVEQDEESFLRWARDAWACVIFNLHVVHTDAGVEQARSAFQRLIDLAIARGGSYYLTYHRWATRAQVEACYPQFAEFLRFKLQYDPEERFQSAWYRHYRSMFADMLPAPEASRDPGTS